MSNPLRFRFISSRKSPVFKSFRCSHASFSPAYRQGTGKESPRQTITIEHIPARDRGSLTKVGEYWLDFLIIGDGIKFPDLVHAIKPEQDNEIPQATGA